MASNNTPLRMHIIFSADTSLTKHIVNHTTTFKKWNRFH